MKQITIYYHDFFIKGTGDKQIIFLLEQAMENLKDVDIIVIHDDDNTEHQLRPISY